MYFEILFRVGDGLEFGFWFCLFVIETLFLLIYAVRDLARLKLFLRQFNCCQKRRIMVERGGCWRLELLCIYSRIDKEPQIKKPTSEPFLKSSLSLLTKFLWMINE